MIRFIVLTGWLNFKKIMFEGDLSLVKLSIAIASLLWAAMLFAPGATFDRQTYSIMLHTMSELAWAWLFLLHGVISLWAVIWQRTDKWLAVGDNILGSMLWTGSCYMMIMAFAPTDPLPAAVGANSVLALASWWCLVRNNYGRRT